MMSQLNALELTGRARTHVMALEEPRCILHRDVVAPFLAMRVAAWAEAGIDLAPVSSFRDFERQRLIWNAKHRGERPLLDREEHLLDALSLDADARVDAILWWSALPGASRHHWGTDLDVIDHAAVGADFRPELLRREFAPSAVFHPLDRWLDANMYRFGFFRPYSFDHGGVQPEPWHLSYAPIAERAREDLTVEVIREAIESAEVAGRDVILATLPAIHARYVEPVDHARRI